MSSGGDDTKHGYIKGLLYFSQAGNLIVEDVSEPDEEKTEGDPCGKTNAKDHNFSGRDWQIRHGSRRKDFKIRCAARLRNFKLSLGLHHGQIKFCEQIIKP